MLVALGGGELHTYRLGAGGELLLGRDLDCDVVLDHHRVSRRHARLRAGGTGDALAIEDLGSRNGTRVGESLRPNQPCPIRPGDAIGIGPFMLTVVRAAEQAPSAVVVVAAPAAAALPPALLPVARGGAHVLLRGDLGEGPQVLAEGLHRLSGRGGRFVALDCAALAPDALGRELVGALEAAGQGTVLLDAVDALPAAVQQELLQLLEGRGPRAIAARLVCAPRRRLRAAVEAGAFRLDLYYRIAGATVTIREPAVGLTPEQDAERHRLLDALDQCGGNQTRAAKLLGISRGALASRLASCGISRPPRPRR